MVKLVPQLVGHQELAEQGQVDVVTDTPGEINIFLDALIIFLPEILFPPDNFSEQYSQCPKVTIFLKQQFEEHPREGSGGFLGVDLQQKYIYWVGIKLFADC